MNALRATDLHAAYGAVPVLTGVSFAMEVGEVLALLGRNGVGKTTLMRTLIGLLPLKQGDIELDGRSITRLAPNDRARRGIAFVPQGRGIFAKLTVEENLRIGTRAQRSGRGAIPVEVFSYFPVLAERLAQAGGTLSGGEQQMLAIARALCGRPGVLLLDEPSEGIQPSIVQELGRLIANISEQTGMAVLLVEQNIDLALQISRRCLVMEKGRIVREGKPQDFRDEATLRRFLAI
jgi:urea transport system ATP-binding protein